MRQNGNPAIHPKWTSLAQSVLFIRHTFKLSQFKSPKIPTLKKFCSPSKGSHKIPAESDGYSLLRKVGILLISSGPDPFMLGLHKKR